MSIYFPHASEVEKRLGLAEDELEDHDPHAIFQAVVALCQEEADKTKPGRDVLAPDVGPVTWKSLGSDYTFSDLFERLAGSAARDTEQYPILVASADVFCAKQRAADLALIAELKRENDALRAQLAAAQATVTLTARQLQHALALAWPDGKADPQQAETVVTLHDCKAVFTAIDEEGALSDMPAGVYLSYDDLPDDGIVALSDDEPDGALASEVPAVLADQWLMALQTVVGLDGQEPRLGYTIIPGQPLYSSFDETSAAIKKANLPLGWVAGTVRQFICR